MIKINAQLRKYFILIAMFSIVFITIVSNISIYILFSNYIIDMRTKDDVKIVQYVELEYNGYSDLNSQSQMNIMHYVLSENIAVRIRDINYKIIYDSSRQNNIFKIPINENSNNKDIEYKNYPINFNGEQVGTVDIGRSKSILSNAEDKQFLRTMNAVFAVSFIFSLMISLLLSSQISKKFLNPIYNIKENAKLIENGKYKKLIDVKTNTYELNDLSESVKELSQKLDSQESLRKRMTNDLAHELRTPIATVQSHIEAFMDGVWEPDIEKLSIIHDEVSRLTKLINELADLSIVENDDIKLNKTKVDLSALLNNIVLSFEPMLISKNINIDNKIQNYIIFFGDEERLKRIFINIISNAYKYTNENGNICVSLEQLKDKIIISVEDSGIGIPKEDIKHLFERFYRSDISRNRKTGGIGIGLTITKALIDAHGGTINILSEQGQGTKVIIEFVDDEKNKHAVL